MTENEAIEVLKEKYRTRSMYIDVEDCKRHNQAISMGISALEEIQKYRVLGTVEELKHIVENKMLYLVLLDEYKELGAVEELREATEKLRVKKPIGVDMCICPNCGTYNETIKKRRNTVNQDIVYCWHCGQAMEIKRSEEE